MLKHFLQIEIFQKYLGKKKMTSIKVVCGDEEKIIDVDIKMLKTLDKDYFDCITSDKFKKEEYLEYGLDDKYESIEGFEEFMEDYCKGEYPIEFCIKSQLDVQVLQTADRFDKLCIYVFQRTVEEKSKIDSKRYYDKCETYIDPYILLRYSSEVVFHKVIDSVKYYRPRYFCQPETTWEYIKIKEGFKCFDLLPYQIKRKFKQEMIDIELHKDEIEKYRLDTLQYCDKLRIIYGCSGGKTEGCKKAIGYYITVKYVGDKYKVTIDLDWSEKSDAGYDYSHFGYGKGVEVSFITIVDKIKKPFILLGDIKKKEHTFYLDKSYKHIEICKDQVLKFY